MTKISSAATKTVRPAHLQSLLDPLASMSGWTDKAAARSDLEMLASTALGLRNHSLWWNYIYLHERYVEFFSPTKHDVLPGFPDMDTAIKVGAPSVYNWYYGHHQIPTTPWAELPLADLSLCLRAGFVSQVEADAALAGNFPQWQSTPPDARRQEAPPLWLLSIWEKSPAWGTLLTALHHQQMVQSAGISALDRQVLDPAFLWQWSCLTQKDISFLPQDQASQALDDLRFSSLGEALRTRCETHFLDYFPQCKPVADIAFSLGGPLFVPVIDTLDGELSSDVFEAGHEALHAK